MTDFREKSNDSRTLHSALHSAFVDPSLTVYICLPSFWNPSLPKQIIHTIFLNETFWNPPLLSPKDLRFEGISRWFQGTLQWESFLYFWQMGDWFWGLNARWSWKDAGTTRGNLWYRLNMQVYREHRCDECNFHKFLCWLICIWFLSRLVMMMMMMKKNILRIRFRLVEHDLGWP